MSKKHNRTSVTVAFCTGHSHTQKGPKISDKKLRKAPKLMQEGMERDLAENGHPVAKDVFIEGELENIEDIPLDAHIIKVVALTKPSKHADWVKIWAGDMPCEHVKVTA